MGWGEMQVLCVDSRHTQIIVDIFAGLCLEKKLLTIPPPLFWYDSLLVQRFGLASYWLTACNWSWDMAIATATTSATVVGGVALCHDTVHRGLLRPEGPCTTNELFLGRPLPHLPH